MSVPEAATAAAPTITRQSVAKAISWAGLGHLISQATWFASLLVLAVLVPPRDFGVVAAGMVIVNIATLLVGSGTRGSIIVAKRLDLEHVRYALWLTSFAGLALTGLVMLLAKPIVSLFAAHTNAAILQGLVLSVGMFGLSIVPIAMLEKQMRFKAETVVMGSASIISAIVAIAAGALGAGVWALVLRQVLWSTLVTVFAWIAARRLLPSWRQLIGRGRRPERVQRPGAGWFFVLATFNLIAMSVDYLVVGHLTNATGLGLYSLAFTLGFAPLTQFSWRLGGVLLPAVAATSGLEVVGRRTLLALRTTAALLLPLVVPALVLAPWLIPTVFGAKWAHSVEVFQILLPVGIAFAILNMLGEALGGSGNVSLPAKLQILWALLILPALIVLVQVDGIIGAALAHLIVLAPVATGYVIFGSRAVGLRPTQVLEALGKVLNPVAVQAAVSVGVLLVLRQAGASLALRDIAAALSGVLVLAVLVVIRWADGLADARRMVLQVVRG